MPFIFEFLDAATFPYRGGLFFCGFVLVQRLFSVCGAIDTITVSFLLCLNRLQL